jgi:hypothetical protein
VRAHLTWFSLCSLTAIITTAKRIIEQKNEDELFQNFLYNSEWMDGVCRCLSAPVLRAPT